MTARDEQSYEIIGAAMEVHRELGCGFLEAVYHDALLIELSSRGIACEREVEIAVRYKSRTLATAYRADLICHGEILVELKALQSLSGKEEAQVINYLKATGLERALLINFGRKSLEYKRLVMTRR